jgi:hypothetical protein
LLWSKDHPPPDKDNRFEIGVNKIPAKVHLQTDGSARIVKDITSTDDQQFVEWDANQMLYYQNIKKFPEHTRICISQDGLTLIFAIPGVPLEALSLLWEAKSAETFKLRGWRGAIRTPWPQWKDELACVRGINEVRLGTAVITKILHDVIPETEDCEPAAKGQYVGSFVRGLLTPTELPGETDGASKAFPCVAVNDKPDKNRMTWYCKTNSEQRRIEVNFALPASDKDHPTLSLLDSIGNEISRASISIDETVMPRDESGHLLLPRKVHIGCYDKSISVLITSGEKQPRTWAYVIGTQAIEQFLSQMASRDPHLQDKDPTNLVKDQPEDALYTAPSWLFDKVVSYIKSAFHSEPPSLCA